MFSICVCNRFLVYIQLFLLPCKDMFYCIFSLPYFFNKFEKLKFDCRFTFEGMIQAAYLDRSNLSCLEIYCYLVSPNKILSMMDMPTVPFHIILLILGSWILCLHISIYAVLCWRIYYARK